MTQSTHTVPTEPTDRFDGLLLELERAPAGARAPAQDALYEAARELLSSDAGLRALYERASRFDDAGVFEGRPWADPSQLQVPLVGGTLRAPGITPVVEALSELRMLSIATGAATRPRVTQDDAAQFLREVLAGNLRYLFPSGTATEEERLEPDAQRASNERLLSLIAREVGLGRVIDEVADEVDQILAQRPVSTWAVRRTIARAHRLATDEGLEGPSVDRLQRHLRAAQGPSPVSDRHADPADYREAIEELDADALEVEARAFATAMMETGLVAPQHAVLVRHLVGAAPELLPIALGTDAAGTVELRHNAELVRQLVEASVFATTANCLYGLSRALDRTLLSRRAVTAGLERLLDLEIVAEVQEHLLAQRSAGERVTANGVLLAGTLAVLGQPLGIGQGKNPTCQSARGLSLWAQHNPDYLLRLLVAAARDGRVEFVFKGQRVRSDELPPGVSGQIDRDLDPVSIVLVPHLDRIYSELMRRAALHLEDPHKWVNPAMYGRWVPSELASAFVDPAQTTVQDFSSFAKLSFATHHPAYNGDLRMMYPNPVGLVVTNHQGKYLGPHAVSIQRVEEDPRGEMRVYFYNPNNEGRQNWGNGVTVTVQDHGEIPGESSLPFDDFVSRLYAFHYSPYEAGELDAVPADRVQKITDAARESWGERFVWLEPS